MISARLTHFSRINLGLLCNQVFAFLQPAKLRSTQCPGSRETKGTVMEIASQAASPKTNSSEFDVSGYYSSSQVHLQRKNIGGTIFREHPEGLPFALLGPFALRQRVVRNL